MARVDRIVEIDASEDGEDVGLQERHQQLQGGQRHGEAEGENRAEPAHDTEGAEHRHEAPEHLQSDVAGEHVGEQSDAVGHRPRHKRQNLDEGHERQDVDRDSAGHEQLQEPQSVLPEAVNDDRDEYQKRKGDSDDDVAGDREGVGNDTHHVQHQDEHEE